MSDSDIEDVSSTVVPRSTLLSRRRSSSRASAQKTKLPTRGRAVAPQHSDLSSPDDEGKFRSSLQINMKDLVGDAVGNMSISPTSRDIVLAARKGLFIIDLEAPFQTPRFLPQGGTWDVADVQWNPHPARAEYIVSTSSEKLLIWNLHMKGKTNIEHILHSHYRAITDINWHTFEPDVVVSTGIDSWLWLWDLRDLGHPQKPVLGLCSFGAGGTQVKWNRQDPNILASSHMSEVLIWDRRKGSVPVSRIKAHQSKIYGIDWSHVRRNEIVTCSLDRTIKVWDISQTDSVHSDSNAVLEPQVTIHTRYPVWRARDLPFGQGVLSLPQRGETALEMWSHENAEMPVEVFEGHTDVVKEFVWRRGGQDCQLITWSKDRTLRFWPVTSDIMQKAGHVPGTDIRPRVVGQPDTTTSFREPQEYSRSLPALSAPIGNRTILAEVRANRTPRPPFPGFPSDSALNATGTRRTTPTASSTATTMPVAVPPRPTGGTMSKGNLGGRSARMDTFTWLASVKVEERRESSSGPDSGDVSRLSSVSRPPSNQEHTSQQRRRSESRPRGDEVEGQSLHNEITSSVAKLATYKVKLEKAEFAKKRSCTFGLYGPWGESSHVFIRVTFTFPRDYPQAAYPAGTPTVDLERNPLVSMKTRAFMLRRLRTIRERQRPCLETCLRFLIFGNEKEEVTAPGMDFESSDEDDEVKQERADKDLTLSLVRSQKNLAEPRTSQGVFSPNGEFIWFSRTPPRILVRNTVRNDSASRSVNSHGNEGLPPVLQSPLAIANAIRHLSRAANEPIEPGSRSFASKGAEDAENVLRVMTNLLKYPQQSIPRMGQTGSTRLSTVYLRDALETCGADRNVAARYTFTAESLVEVCEYNAAIAAEHGRFDHERVFQLLGALMRSNDDHPKLASQTAQHILALSYLTRIVMEKLYAELCHHKDIQMLAMFSVILLQAYQPLSAPIPKSVSRSKSKSPATPQSPSILLLQRKSSVSFNDYFNFRRRHDSQAGPRSPIHPPRTPTSPNRAAPSGTGAGLGAPRSIASSSSSRGSWSSLFNTGSVKQLVAATTGLQTEPTIPFPAKDTGDGVDGSPVPSPPSPPPPPLAPIPVPQRHSETDSRSPRRKVSRYRRDSSNVNMNSNANASLNAAASASNTSPKPRSWTESSGLSAAMLARTSSSSGGSAGNAVVLPVIGAHVRRPTFSQVISSQRMASTGTEVIHEKTIRFFPAPSDGGERKPRFRSEALDMPSQQLCPPSIPPPLQLVQHVLAYGELLDGWELPEKRAEMIKAVGKEVNAALPGVVKKEQDAEVHLGLMQLCAKCGKTASETRASCRNCRQLIAPRCSICRLPVKGLSFNCARCAHTTHATCRINQMGSFCSTGCGCSCFK